LSSARRSAPRGGRVSCSRGLRALGPIVLALLPSGAASAELPDVLYMLHCQGCHLADGSGSPGAVPALGGSMARFLTVPGGREYLVRVPGSATSRLSDAELSRVLNWMVQRFGPASAAHAAAPYTEAEVAALRRRPLADVEALRLELLERIGP
jgi:mono/diheme cytochrome c family protein